jgi:hypothetical protein
VGNGKEEVEPVPVTITGRFDPSNLTATDAFDDAVLQFLAEAGT